jgi:hypothetical protein
VHATDPTAELASILVERNRLVRLVLWTLVATFATALAGLMAVIV